MSRLTRGWIAGSFATGVAAASHGIADGAGPSAFALIAALVFAGVLGTLVIGKTPSLPRLTLVVGGAQFAFHLVFSWLTPGTATAAGHHGVSELLAPAAAHHGGDPGMWAAHVIAMVATLAFLRHAELALFELLREQVLAVVEIARRVPAITPRPVAHRAVPATEPRHPVLLLLQFVVSHRGPPTAAASH